MKAMIFAAGLGTRLMPLTRNVPKALVTIRGKPLLQLLIERLVRFGYREILVNVHHHSGKIKTFLDEKKNFGIRIEISDEKDKLLDTGGGLKKASWFFDDGQPFLVHNVDVITNLDLSSFREHHMRSGAFATLAVLERETSRYLWMDEDQRLCGWENVKTGETVQVFPEVEYRRVAFSGIHMIDPRLIPLIQETGRFSIIPVYLRLAAKTKILLYPHSQDVWMDVGKPEDLGRASNGSGIIIDG